MKINLSERQKRKIVIFSKARERLVEMMIKKDDIKERRIKSHAILITFFGCGKLRHGSGSLASFVALLIWLGCSIYFAKYTSITTFQETLIWITISFLFFIYGLVFVPIYSRIVGEVDHYSIVIDEVVGQIVALSLTYPLVKDFYFDDSLFINKIIALSHIILSFTLFRFFDVTKPLFIGVIDRKMKNSLGVMLDDLVCGLLAAAINGAIFKIYEYKLMQLHNLIV